MNVNQLAYYMQPIKNYIRELQDKGLDIVAYLDRGYASHRPNIDIVALDENGTHMFTVASGIYLDYTYPLMDTLDGPEIDERALRDLYDDAALRLRVKFGEPDPLDTPEFWSVGVVS